MSPVFLPRFRWAELDSGDGEEKGNRGRKYAKRDFARRTNVFQARRVDWDAGLFVSRLSAW